MITKFNNFIKENSNPRDSDSHFVKTYEDTEHWLNLLNIHYFTINDDLTVDVDGDVILTDKKINKLSIQFNSINGDFEWCRNPKLISLKGCPKIVDGKFLCSGNKNLKSLKYCPAIVNGGFYSYSNELTSLEYAPKIIKNGDFSAFDNNLTDLVGAPEYVNEKFWCYNNPLLTSLTGLNPEFDLDKLDVRNIPLVWAWLETNLTSNPELFNIHKEWILNNEKSMPESFKNKFDWLLEIELYNR